ncbi:MAG: hypothetical protein ACXVEB_17750, partial [Bacteroidia bacterium]
LDKSSRKTIPFAQRYLGQMGVKVGDVVSFQSIANKSMPGTGNNTGTGGTSAAASTSSSTVDTSVLATALRLIK